MKRRTLIRTAAIGTATTGIASAASAASLGDADGPYTFVEVDGQRVVKPVSELDDVETQDHCHEFCCEDCATNPCGWDHCVWETCCQIEP